MLEDRHCWTDDALSRRSEGRGSSFADKAAGEVSRHARTRHNGATR
jgi:hypothetical protein